MRKPTAESCVLHPKQSFVFEKATKTSIQVRTSCSRAGKLEVSSRTAGAAGFCFSVSSHAKGVASRCAFDAVSRGARALKFLSRVLEILFTGFHLDDFFDDRHEVGQRAHGRQRRGLDGPNHAAHRAGAAVQLPDGGTSPSWLRTAGWRTP